MDEQLARSVAEGLVKVTEPPAGAYSPLWVVTFGAGASTQCLAYEREEVAGSVAQALHMLAITAIKRYNGVTPRGTPRASPVSGPGKKDLPPVPLGGLMPDLFAGELEAMSKVLGRVSGLLGKEARRLLDLRQAAADLAAEADTAARCMPEGSGRDFLLLKVSAVAEALSALEKE